MGSGNAGAAAQPLSVCRAHFKVADRETWAHPVVSGNRVFVRDRESVALWTIE